MIVKTINLYSFNELSEDAQQKAIDKWRHNDYDDFEWQAEHIIEDFATICKILGITLDYKNPVSYSVGYCQSDYASFFGTYRYNKGALSKIKQYAPHDTELYNIAKQLQEIQKKYFYMINVSISRSCRVYRDSMSFEINHKNEINISDTDYLELESEFKYIFSHLAHWLYKRLSEALDYVNSDNYIKETILANEYTFTEYGDIEHA